MSDNYKFSAYQNTLTAIKSNESVKELMEGTVKMILIYVRTV